MSEEKATYERVRAAVLHIRGTGSRPTADRVLDLTGGSKQTVLAQLRRLRTEDGDHAAVPPPVLEIARAALTEIYDAGRLAQIDRQRALSERASLLLDEQEAQIEELAQENANLSTAIEETATKLKTSERETAETNERLRAAEATIRDLESRLSIGSDDAKSQLDEVRSKLDTLLALSDLGSMTPTPVLRRAKSGKAGTTENPEDGQ